jgi:PhnB protein
MKINPYLNFKGECEEAFQFYAKVLGGRIDAIMHFEGTPHQEHISPEWRKKVMHACMTVGNFQIMASDCPPEMYEPMQGTSVALHLDTPEDADRIYNALSEKGTIKMPLQETFWAHRFGMFTDKYGTPWMINCAKPM